MRKECCRRRLLGLGSPLSRTMLWGAGVHSPPPGELLLKLKLIHEKHFLPCYFFRQTNHLITGDTLCEYTHVQSRLLWK